MKNNNKYNGSNAVRDLSKSGNRIYATLSINSYMCKQINMILCTFKKKDFLKEPLIIIIEINKFTSILS